MNHLAEFEVSLQTSSDY